MKETFVDGDGVEKNKYVKCSERQLEKQWKEVKAVVEHGRLKGFISDGDAKVMVPE